MMRLFISILSIIYTVMRSLLLLSLLVKLSIAFAQEKPLVLVGQLLGPQIDIGPFTTFYKDISGDTGMQVTADRIRMINQLYTIQTLAHNLGLAVSFGAPYGTRVILETPI